MRESTQSNTSYSTIVLHYIILCHIFSGLQADLDHFTNAGADRILLKPLDMAVFSEVMRDKK